MAAPIAGRAAGGEILASHVVRALVTGKSFQFVDRRKMKRRGFDDPVRLFEVRCGGSLPSFSLDLWFCCKLV